MNSTAFTQPARRAPAHSKAAPRHAHLSFAETPEDYLREEMA